MADVTRSQVRRLGERLRSAPTIAEVSEADLELLQQIRSEYDEHLAAVRHRLAATFPDAAITSRLKTIQTIQDKLRREHAMALGRMADIAGVRIVKEMGRTEQDDLVATIVTMWPQCRIVDRRSNPSFGYRAVHAIVLEDSIAVEVQIRTRLQDIWAQVVERLGDAWGRQIRYGEPPEDPNHILAVDFTRARAWATVGQLADSIDQVEKLEVRAAELTARARTRPPSKERGVLLRSIRSLERTPRRKVTLALEALAAISENPALL